jgi:hypothetical protein
MDVTVAVATSEPLSSTANRVSLKSSPFAGMSLAQRQKPAFRAIAQPALKQSTPLIYSEPGECGVVSDR